jgi:hypothetical protein
MKEGCDRGGESMAVFRLTPSRVGKGADDDATLAESLPCPLALDQSS